MTYDKKTVLAAANKTAQTMRAERKAGLDAWDAQNILVRFFYSLALGSVGRPSWFGVERQQTAERISFKATVCVENVISLTDHEIDTIRDYWGLEQ